MHVDLLSLDGGGTGLSFGKDFDGVLFSELFAKGGEGGEDGKGTEKEGFHYKTCNNYEFIGIKRYLGWNKISINESFGIVYVKLENYN